MRGMLIAAASAALLTTVVAGGSAAVTRRDPQHVAALSKPLVYVADSAQVVHTGRRIAAFGIDANGDVPPALTIEGPHTRLEAPSFVAIDGAGELFVVNYNVLQPAIYPDVAVFAKGAGGDAKPIRELWLAPASRSAPPRPFIAVDPAGYLYSANEQTQSIDVYAPNAVGTPAPVHSIRGPHTRISNLFGVTIDPQGNIVATGYVTNKVGTARVLVFPPGAKGDVPPAREIRGVATQLYGPGQCAVDGAGYLYVSDNTNMSGRILVFAPGASGDVAPVRAIYPEQPSFIDGIALHGSEIVTSQVYTPARSIDVYPASANGRTRPLRTIQGPRTQLQKFLGTIAIE